MDAMDVDRDLVARVALAQPSARTTGWRVESIPNPHGTPTTESLERVAGTARVNGAELSFTAVGKTVRSIRHFPSVAALPPEVQAAADAMLPWRVEPEVYASGLHGSLPDELSAPRLYAIEELAGDRARIWMEDVAGPPITWGVTAYTNAAYALGRLAGRYPADAIRWVFTPMVRDLHGYVDGRLAQAVVPQLTDEATWSHPVVRRTVDAGLRADLMALWDRAHDLVRLLDSLPWSLVHGDACPQNLLRAREGDGFVLIDWGLTGIGVVGTDLAQLLAGRVQSGDLDVAELPAIELAVKHAYGRGVDREGTGVTTIDLARALDVSLVVGCAFTAIPVERLPPRDAPADPEILEFFDKRARWARMLVDRGHGVLSH